MKFIDWATRVMLISLIFAALIMALLIGKGKQLQNNTTASNPEITTWSQYPQAQLQTEKNQERKSQKLSKSPAKVNTNKITTSVKTNTNTFTPRYTTTQAFASYKPNFEIASVNPTNYGERYAVDINGVPLHNEAIAVLHETSYSASSAINFFQIAHQDESVQASYHAIIKLDGTVIYLVPPEKRAFGAANSVFEGINGLETVQTSPNLPPSVNNFAYHVSLETPPDSYGNSNLQTHSGYTESQYNSLAWLLAQSQISDDRITTHKEVDRSGQKVDPINFDFNKFMDTLNAYREIIPIYRVNK